MSDGQTIATILSRAASGINLNDAQVFLGRHRTYGFSGEDFNIISDDFEALMKEFGKVSRSGYYINLGDDEIRKLENTLQQKKEEQEERRKIFQLDLPKSQAKIRNLLEIREEV